MKSYRNLQPLILVSKEDYDRLADGSKHMLSMKLERKYLKFLPPAYESSTGTQLIFPHHQCPQVVRFRPKWMPLTQCVSRRVVNITAIKNEDMSESLIFRLK